MSTPAATARYIIAADDRTKGAIAAVTGGFRSMERNIKATVSRINLAFGLIAGATLKRTMQNVFNETAKGSKEFAAALADVKHSARSLLAAKDGAPAAAAAMRELSAVLKDPEFVAAADKISSALIRGFVGTVKFATGVKSLREEIEELKRQRDAVVNEPSNQPRTYIKGEPTFTNPADRAYGMSLQIEAKEREMRAQEAAEMRQREERWARITAAGNRVTNRFNTMNEFRENIKFFEEIEKTLKDGPAGDEEFFDQLAVEADIAGLKVREAFFGRMDEAASNTSEMMDRTGDSIDQVSDKIGEAIGATTQMSIAADQAARNIQDAFAQFLFDPFDDGLKGMLSGFLNVLRTMVSETAAAKIFGPKSEGGLGLGDVLSGFFSGVAGGTTGGTGTGSDGLTQMFELFGARKHAAGLSSVPYDNYPALLHKGERVVPRHLNAGGMGGLTINNNIHVDARADRAQVQAEVFEAVRRGSDFTINRVRSLVQQGRL